MNKQEAVQSLHDGTHALAREPRPGAGQGDGTHTRRIFQGGAIK